MNSNVLTVSLTDPLEGNKGGLGVGCKFLKYFSNYDNQPSHGLYLPTHSGMEKLQGRASR
jgi:hypothetical protein